MMEKEYKEAWIGALVSTFVVAAILSQQAKAARLTFSLVIGCLLSVFGGLTPLSLCGMS